MRTLLIIISIIAFLSPVQSQKVVSAKSQPTKIELNPEYKRGLPPILYASLSFEDDNNNSILEANEKAKITLDIRNQGKGPAQDLRVTVKDSIVDPNLLIGIVGKIPFLLPNEQTRIVIPLSAGMEIKSAEHKLTLEIKEYFGYDMDPAYLYVNTIQFQEPRLAFAGLEVVDLGEGTQAIRQDGKLQAGEQVKVKITIQNQGQNVSKNTRYTLKSRDQNIFIPDGEGTLGDLGIGEVKELWVTISPNKRVTTTGNLPLFLTLMNEPKRGQLVDQMLPLNLDQKPPDPVILNVRADMDKLQKQVFRYEVNSDRMTVNVGNVIDIRQVSPSIIHRRNAIAVVIGIEKYDHFVVAPYAENDASLLQNYFKNALGIEKVYTYKSKEVSGFFFDNTFNPSFGELQKAIKKGETDLFVFYSGHGIPSKDGSMVFLLPSDGRMEAIESQGYDLNKLYANLQKLGAKSVTVFMDACFSGASRGSEQYKTENLTAMKGGVRIKTNVDQPWIADPAFTVFVSSEFSETSLSFDPSETGLFTYYLCAGMQGKADLDGDKKITSGELSRYVIDRVKETSIKIRGLQTPQFHGDENVVLIEY